MDIPVRPWEVSAHSFCLKNSHCTKALAVVWLMVRVEVSGEERKAPSHAGTASAVLGILNAAELLKLARHPHSGTLILAHPF